MNNNILLCMATASELPCDAPFSALDSDLSSLSGLSVIITFSETLSPCSVASSFSPDVGCCEVVTSSLSKASSDFTAVGSVVLGGVVDVFVVVVVGVVVVVVVVVVDDVGVCERVRIDVT